MNQVARYKNQPEVPMYGYLSVYTQKHYTYSQVSDIRVVHKFYGRLSHLKEETENGIHTGDMD